MYIVGPLHFQQPEYYGATKVQKSSQPVVISLHGIKTRGAWQHKLAPEISDAGMTPVPLDYGNFLAVQLLIPWVRRKKVDWFHREYLALSEKYKDRSINIVAHSFGTYIVARSLEKYVDSMRFDRIVFCGSIVHDEMQWPQLIKAGSVKDVLNDYGGMDFWALICAYFVSDAGQSGRYGFRHGVEHLIQRGHPEYRHSDFFHLANYRDVWIPFIKTGIAPDLPKISETDRRPIMRRGFAMVLSILIAMLSFYILSLPWTLNSKKVDEGKPIAGFVYQNTRDGYGFNPPDGWRDAMGESGQINIPKNMQMSSFFEFGKKEDSRWGQIIVYSAYHERPINYVTESGMDDVRDKMKTDGKTVLAASSDTLPTKIRSMWHADTKYLAYDCVYVGRRLNVQLIVLGDPGNSGWLFDQFDRIAGSLRFSTGTGAEWRRWSLLDQCVFALGSVWIVLMIGFCFKKVCFDRLWK